MYYNDSYLLSDNPEIREKFIASIRKVGNIVASTMGSKGKPVLFYTDLGVPRVTNDGITVIRGLNFKDPIEQLAVALIRQVSAKTNWECGDFSSGSAVLSAELIISGIQFDKETDKLIEETVERIKEAAIPVNDVQDLINIATISSKDEVLGKLIGELSDKINFNSSVIIKQSNTGEHYHELINGLSLTGIFAAQEFYRGIKETVTEPKIMLVNDEIVSFPQIQPVFSAIAHDESNRLRDEDFVIFAKSFSQEVVESVALSCKKYHLSIRLATLVVPASIATDTFNNLSLITGSVVMGGKTAYPLLRAEKSAMFDIDNYGTVKELKINRVPNQEFIFIPVENFKEQPHVQDKIKEYEMKIKDSTTSEHELEWFKMLLNQIDGQVANLYIAADGDVESKHLMYKSEDAINACKSAKEMGIIAGGSVALRDAIKPIKDIHPELYKTLRRLYEHILINADIDHVEIEWYIEGSGYDTTTGKYGNMIEMKIIDPAKGLIHGLKNSYSLAKNVNSASTIIIESIDEDTK